MKDIREDIAWAKINRDVLVSLENPRKLYWVIVFGALSLFSVGLGCEIYQYQVGMGVANLNNPNVWGLYIATFIFWIGMSHSGTLLSAILHLMHADWRKPIYRFAEAMTTFSLMTAGLFVMVHIGRLWQFYYALPYPNDRGTWPNFQSPLLWDAMAIFTYLSSSVLFLYVGMIPDLAICRDNLHKGWRKKLYTLLALGWEGTDRQWRNFRVT
ncbi:MAG: polysulfide reductase, partial [Gallionellales bacterium CG_4_8_14_3_um_filter_54_18]